MVLAKSKVGGLAVRGNRYTGRSRATLGSSISICQKRTGGRSLSGEVAVCSQLSTQASTP